jgi:hypothetical protein
MTTFKNYGEVKIKKSIVTLSKYILSQSIVLIVLFNLVNPRFL